MKSVILLAFVCVAVAQIYPTNYTTVYSNQVVSGSLIEQPADNDNGDYDYYNGYIPQLFAFDAPTSSQAVFVTLAQTDTNCASGLLVYVSNYGFPCYEETEGLYSDICQAVGALIIDSDNGDDNYYVLSTINNEYEGSDDDLQFSFNPGQRLFFSVLRNEEDEDTTNCSFTLNITSVNGCSGNNSVGFGVESVDYDETPAYISENDVYCYTVIDLGTVVNTTNTLGYSVVHQNFSGLFRFYLPENVAYVNVSIRSLGSEDLYIYGVPSPSTDVYDAESDVEIQNCGESGCNYDTQVATGFFSDVAPSAGAYYVAVYNDFDFEEDSTNGVSFNLSISVTVCPAGTAGANCQYNLYPVDFTALFTTGQQVYVANGGATYLYFDISPAYATLSFNLYAWIQDTTSDDNEAYLYINKDKFPLGQGGEDLNIEEYSNFIEESYPIVSFSQLDFLGNSGRYYMAVFCNQDNSDSGLTSCNTTLYANFTNVGSNSGLSTGGLTGSTSNSTGTVSTTTTVGTSTTSKVTSTATSTTTKTTAASSTTTKASTSASTTTTKASTTASSTTGSASSVVPSVIALVAIVAMMF